MNRAIAIVLALGGALLGTTACESPPSETTVPGRVGDPTPVDLGTGPDRPLRRMDIEQLDAAMRRATGGIGWDDGSGNPQFTRFRTTAEPTWTRGSSALPGEPGRWTRPAWKGWRFRRTSWT